jgi:leader peptidase (prepilin peptidase)/N-methyltransferase
MSGLERFLVIALGLVLGSFLNVVIHRLPRDESLAHPGSHCPACQAPVRWFHNIPVLGYLALRGRCASCGVRISPRYPLVELLTALLFSFSYLGLPADLSAAVAQFRIWIFVLIGISVTFIDLDHRIIPHTLSFGGWGVGLLTCMADYRHGPWELVLASVAGFGFFFLFGLLYEKITGRVGLGGGDVNFMGTIGAFLGFGGIWSAILISSVTGSVIGILFALWAKRQEGASSSEDGVLRLKIPYGPFLVFGALVELFFGVSSWIGL